MAAGNFAEALAHVLRHEGGYVDHPRDPGGATNFGITRASLSDWRGRVVSKADVRDLTRAEAAAIYRARYWDAVRADDLPAGLDYCVFDAAVNSGPKRAGKWLQAAVRVRQDGIVGPLTIAAAARGDAARHVEAVCDLRLSFLRGLSTWEVFGNGWQVRVGDVRRSAREMAARPPAPAAAPVPPPPPAEAASTGLVAALVAFLRAVLTGGLGNRQ